VYGTVLAFEVYVAIYPSTRRPHDPQRHRRRHPIPTRSGLSDETAGMLLGLAGVAIFSLTLPFTRMAVRRRARSGLSPTFVALGRALVGAALAGAWLLLEARAAAAARRAAPLAMVASAASSAFPG
jgi:hypothetical protein